MTGDELVPCFVPPLALVLARAESDKGGPLTEAEVLVVRDRAVCMMMRPEDARAMEESRGYRDVAPEDCWADWHRLRPQLVGGYLPRIVLCVPGGEDFPELVASILAEAGLPSEVRGRDDRMAEAFEAAACRIRPSIGTEELGAIDGHASVLYVLSQPLAAAEAPAAALSFLELARRLLEAGGLAAKCESTGIAHSKARWIELSGRAAREPWAALLEAWVHLPIASETDLYTCGMHLLGRPDLIVSRASASPGDAVDLFLVFATYLLSECPEGAFASGHTFRTAQDAPVFQVTWEPCADYEEDDFFFNPFGRWRFTPR